MARGVGAAVMAVALLLCALSARSNAQTHTYEYYVSTDDGNDDQGCGADDKPCKSISHVLDTKLTDTIGQYYLNLAPGVYAGTANTHLVIEGVGLVAIRLWEQPDQANKNLVIDCSDGPDTTVACFEHLSAFSLRNVEIQGTVNTPLIRSNASIEFKLRDSAIRGVRVVDDPKPGGPYFALIEGFSGSGARTAITNSVVEDIDAPLLFLSNKHALDVYDSQFLNSDNSKRLPFMELDSGPDTAHVLNCQNNVFRNITGYAALMRYSPTGERGTMLLDNNTFTDNSVTDAMIHFEGASLLGSNTVFENNDGQWSVRMFQVENKLGLSMQLSWARCRVVNSPTIELEDAQGYFRDISFHRSGKSDKHVPALVVRNPVDLSIKEILVEDYVAETADNGADGLVVVEGAASSYEVDNMHVVLTSAAFLNNIGYSPLKIQSTDPRGLLVAEVQGNFRNNTNAAGNGGAIAVEQLENDARMRTAVSGSSFFSNKAVLGGAVYCTGKVNGGEAPTLEFEGGLLGFVDNEASEKGTDVYIQEQSPCTVVCDEDAEYVCEGVESSGDFSKTSGMTRGGRADDGYLIAALIIGILCLFAASLGSALMALNIFIKLRQDRINL